MTTLNTQPLPSLPQLFKATALAVIVAAAILVTTILPAEYGIDPTGIGKAFGLTSMSSAGASKDTQSPIAAAAPPSSPVIVAPVVDTSSVAKSDIPFRSDEMTLTLQPNEGAEIKASMRKGEQFVFSWEAQGGLVNFDMHGERPNAGSEFTSYWKAQQQTNAQGTFAAPFDGSHGWYWGNRGDKLVTVKVKVSGFYEKLYRP